MSTQPPSGVHEIDLLAQRLYEEIERDALFLQKALAGPAPVGTRKLTPSQWAKRLMKMDTASAQMQMAQLPGNMPAAASIMDQLGPFGLALLPYLQPTALLPERAIAPQGPGAVAEEMF